MGDELLLTSIIVSISNLSYAYSRSSWVFQDVTFSIQRGEILSLVGPSGAGKTTLGYILKGLIPHAIRGGTLHGTIRVAGYDIRKISISHLARIVGMVFQDINAQLFSTSVQEEIEFGLRNLNLNLEWAQEAMNFLQIQDLADQMPMNLSAGQKQRVVLASILASHPELVILDEPTAHLDPIGKSYLKKWLQQLNQQYHTAILLIDQDAQFVGDLTHDVLVFQNHTVYRRMKTEVLEQIPQWSWKENW